MNVRLDGKRALITGSASGIGKAIALEFAAAGAEVVVLDLDPARVEATVKELPSSTLGLPCDVSDEAAVQAAFAKLDGRLDILVNSAGIAHIGSVLNTGVADFNRLYRVNVQGTFLCMQAAAKIMQQGSGGVILNLASVAATSGLSDRFAYSMTKGAVLSMTLSAAKDLLPFAIRVNCMSPGRVHTPFVDGFVAANYPGRESEMMDTLARAQPIGRMGTPEEIATMALYLCSDAASFITGADMPIDGGFATIR